jgi:hypothetical protein
VQEPAIVGELGVEALTKSAARSQLIKGDVFDVRDERRL